MRWLVFSLAFVSLGVGFECGLNSGPPTTAHLDAFGYVRILKGSGRQELVRGVVSRVSSNGRRRVVIGRAMASVAGIITSGPYEEFTALAASPDNRYLAAFSFQSGTGFVDNNLLVYDLASGDRALFANEHSLGSINRATCRSAAFEAFLESKAAEIEATPEILAAYDYAVSAEGPLPTARVLGWTSNSTIMVQYRVAITASNRLTGRSFKKFAEDNFVVEFDVPGSTPPAIRCCNTPRPLAALPTPTIKRDVRNSDPGLRDLVLYKKRPLYFSDRSNVIWLKSALFASMVGGFPR